MGDVLPFGKTPGWEFTREEAERRHTANARRKIGAIRIGSVDSSDPKKPPYGIFIGSDHVVFCECPAYEHSRTEVQTCKHLESFLEACRGVNK